MTEDAVFELLSLECRVNAYGTVRYYNSNGVLHRVHGPAVIYEDGAHVWCCNGKIHRVDGPAIEYADGRREWYQSGQLHRLEGPAIEYPDGKRVWWQNGQPHRVDSPADERLNWVRACISTAKNWLSLKWVRKWLSWRLYD